MESYKVVVFSYNKELSGVSSVGEDGSSSGDLGIQFVITKLKKLIKKENK